MTPLLTTVIDTVPSVETVSSGVLGCVVGVVTMLIRAARKRKRNERSQIMAALTELKGLLEGLTAQLAKAEAEIVAKVAALESALSNVALPPEAVAALEALKAQVQKLDDLNPDPVAPPVEPAPAPAPIEPPTDEPTPPPAEPVV